MTQQVYLEVIFRVFKTCSVFKINSKLLVTHHVFIFLLVFPIIYPLILTYSIDVYGLQWQWNQRQTGKFESRYKDGPIISQYYEEWTAAQCSWGWKKLDGCGITILIPQDLRSCIHRSSEAAETDHRSYLHQTWKAAWYWTKDGASKKAMNISHFSYLIVQILQ